MAIDQVYFKKPIAKNTGPSINTVHSDFVFNKRNEFSRREVGLNHPDTLSFVKLNDSGDIEIMASPGVGIIISSSTRSISLFADTFKIYTTEDDGIRWNQYAFNYAGTDFTEPFLVSLKDFQKSPAYHNYEEKIGKIQALKNITDNNSITINTDYEYDSPSIKRSITLNTIDNYENFLSDEHLKLLQELAKTKTIKFIDYMKELLYNGYTFNQAKVKAERDIGSVNE